MKKLKPRRCVIVGDTTYYHGDYVTALIERMDEDDEEQDGVEVQNARICINKINKYHDGARYFQFWICQDDRDGCDEAEEKFGFRYSWSVRVDQNGEITSGDTNWINLESRCEPNDVETVVDVNPSIETPSKDDDPMPEDWTPSEKDLLFLKG